MLRIVTTRYAISRMIQTMGVPNDTLLLNATVKSGLKTFAPTWEMVDLIRNFSDNKPIMSKKRREDLYRTQYNNLMYESQRNNKSHWDMLAGFKTIVLVCYCADDEFCHRDLLKDLVIEYLDLNHGLTYTYSGQVTIENMAEYSMRRNPLTQVPTQLI